MSRVARTLRMLARVCSAAAAELESAEFVTAPVSDSPSESLAIAKRHAHAMQVRRVMEKAFGPTPTGQA